MMLALTLTFFTVGTWLMIYFGCFYSQAFATPEEQEQAFKRTAYARYIGFVCVWLAFAFSWFV